MDSWCTTAPSPFESIRAAFDMSFNEKGNPRSALIYQRYTKIEVACRHLRSALVAWRSCNQDLDFEFAGQHEEEEKLPSQIRHLNRMH